MKFTLRDLFWLVLVAAVVTMWWMDRSKLADQLKLYEPARTIIRPLQMSVPNNGRLRAFPASSDESVDPFGPIKSPTVRDLINDNSTPQSDTKPLE